MIEKNKLRSNLKNLDYKDFALSEINIKFLNTLIHQKKFVHTSQIKWR